MTMTKPAGFAAFATSVLLLAACAGPADRKDAATHEQNCLGLQLSHEWGKARNACEKAIDAAQEEGAPAGRLAMLWLEYGRTSGILCDYGEAQRGLDEALKLQQAGGIPTSETLLEMARLDAAQGNYDQAAVGFDAFFQSAPANVLERQDPAGLADAMDERAEANRRAGRESLAQEQRGQAITLRAANPGKAPNQKRTPYGRFCGQGG